MTRKHDPSGHNRTQSTTDSHFLGLTITSSKGKVSRRRNFDVIAFRRSFSVSLRALSKEKQKKSDSYRAGQYCRRKWSVTQRGLYGAGSSLGKSARSSNSNVHCRSPLNIRVTETRANTDADTDAHTQACMYNVHINKHTCTNT